MIRKNPDGRRYVPKNAHYLSESSKWHIYSLRRTALQNYFEIHIEIQ